MWTTSGAWVLRKYEKTEALSKRRSTTVVTSFILGHWHINCLIHKYEIAALDPIDLYGHTNVV
jgi:hypothetical protein